MTAQWRTTITTYRRATAGRWTWALGLPRLRRVATLTWDVHRLPRLPSLRGDLRAGADRRGRPPDRGPGQPRPRVQPRVHLSQGCGVPSAGRGPRPPPQAAGEGGWKVPGSMLGGGVPGGRGRAPADPRGARERRRG